MNRDQREKTKLFQDTLLDPLVTGTQSRALDLLAIEQCKIDAFTLMETAGHGAATELIRYLKTHFPSPSEASPRFFSRGRINEAREASTSRKLNVLCLCGKGNNAGDALVTARYLVLSGHFHVDLFMVSPLDHLSVNTARNLELFLQFSPETQIYKDLDETLYPGSPESTTYSILVDGLLGSGIQTPLREPYLTLIHQLNRWKEKQNQAWIVSMDLPSGLDADTGENTGAILKADLTFCFGPKKTGLLLLDGPECSGQVISIPLSFPFHLRGDFLRKFSPSDRYGLTGATIPKVRRPTKTRHKYDKGVVYVIGGSPGLTGAPLMASRAAWEKGASAVFVAIPDSLLPSIEDQAPGLIKIQTGTGHSVFQPEDAEILAGQLHKRPGVVLIGPGLGKASVQNGFLQQFLNILPDVPIVLDADALRGWTIDSLWTWRRSIIPFNPGSKSHSQRFHSYNPIVLTPHPGEAKELFQGIKPGAISQEKWGVIGVEPTIMRLQIATEVSTQFGITICSKGDPVGVCTPHFQALSDYPTEGFHRAGFGDVLSGQIAANLSFGVDAGHAVLDALLYGYEQWLEKNRMTSSPVSPEDIL